jgi:chemosensory pili system protein ChpA (sensor histidine kinase/response regulator)
MATAREHFALDWIKADLLETLNDARIALDDYAEQGNDETRMRACLTGLHQVHGTLVMLELKGVTQLADHLEQLAQAMLAKSVKDEAASGQALMQGILELPGYLDELQRGADDNVSTSMPLVNEIRELLQQEPLVDPAGASLREGASDQVIARFNAIGGPEKVIRIRSAYQNVLLSILKGEDRSAAVGTLGKIAIGLEKVTEGAPLARQWQAFAEFVDSLKKQTGVLESEAVKLLRRVDLEIKNLAKDGEAALRRPVNMELVEQLLDAAVERDNRSEAVTGLQEALARDVSNNTLAISGRQALGSAAGALQEDLGQVKDKLDLLVRADSIDLEALRQLMTPLKQIGSTLSLLGFESSREIIVDQVEAIESLVVLGDDDPQAVQSIAGALVQIDENLSSVIQGSGQSEVEQITSDAQLQVLREARKDLDVIKQSIVDFVTAHWSIGHLQDVPGKLVNIGSTLEIIPLPKAIEMLARVTDYISSRLMQGYRPEWQELDQFADVISALDYYLERLADETSSGAEDILQVAERSLADIEMMSAAFVAEQQVEVPRETLEAEEAPAVELEALDTSASEISISEPEDSALSAESDVELNVEETVKETDVEAIAADMDAIVEEVPEDATLDLDNLPELEEPKLELEEDTGFDLSSDVFAGLSGTVEPGDDEAQQTDVEDHSATQEVEAAPEPVEPQSVEPVATAAAESDIEPPDPEIVEIFVEEVDEVFETIGEYLPQWASNFDNNDALTEVRRGFHTLKGSGRIVQAVAIGELAWGIENMLNRVMDGTVQPNDQFVEVINAGLALVPGLRAAFEQGQSGDLEAITAVIEKADVLASGGTLESVAVAPATPEMPVEPETNEIEAPEDAPELAAASEASEIGEDWLDEVELEASFTADDTEQEPATAAYDSTVDLFVTEAREHLANLAAENAREPWALTDPIARAFHTLTGGAALAELPQVQLIVEPAYQVVEALRSAPPTAELEAFFKSAEEHLSACLDALQSGAHWEEPLEFVAAADDLLAAGGNAPRAVDQLLDSPATSTIFESEEAVLEYLSAADRGEEVAPVAHLPETLSSVAQLATQMHTQSLSQLAAELNRSFSAAATLERLPAGASTIMRAGYHQLIDQLNEIAAGSEPALPVELIAALAELDFTPPVATQEDAQIEQPAAEIRADEAQANEVLDADAAELAEVAEVDADLVEVFFEEADEICEALETSILSWSAERDNRLYMENMLRGLHTLKGGARLCGLSTLGDMAHDFESVVIEVQNNERKVDDALFADLNQRYDTITARLQKVSGQLGQASTAEVAATPSLPDEKVVPVEQVQAPVRPVIEESSQPAVAADKPAEVSDVNRVLEAVNLQQAAAKAESADTQTPAGVDPVTAQATVSAEKATPERGSQEMVRVGSALLEELVNLAGESSILRARIEQGMSDFTGALDEMETTIERLREQLRRLEIETETQILHRHERNDGPQYENFDPLEMDRYNQLQQLSRSLSESASDMLDLKETLLFKARESETLLLQQARINTELQEGLMRTRMVPFSRLLPRLRRIVRQVSGELEKEVDFHVQNAEGELDRNLLERMVPPLEHMLRNAVDHGIEDADLRRTYGKAAMGRIDLRLTREGGDVVIEISDDGAGIDVETVREKAIERGLMAADAQLNDEEVLQFVLAAGFSTAKSVTQISGRGVGLDVVASEVKQLGGSVNILSRPGKGTRFILRVPFTVSVNRALMVSVAEDLYAIPLNTIEGIVLLSPDQLQALYSSDSKTFEYAGVPYRVRYLGQYLGREYRGTGGTQTSVPVVLVRSGDHAVAIHVDLVQGSREIVVKSLGPQFAGVGGISGATILGDGSVVVILDLLALIRAQQFERTQRGGAARVRTGPRCVMVVDDSVTVRKVTSRLLERQGMDVLVAKDGVEAVALLQERRPDVMLLDIEMPRMDGFEVARQVRHDDRLGDLPIVMISSRTGDKHKEHANQLGVNKFLGKPFQENELLATIDELVSPN